MNAAGHVRLHRKIRKNPLWSLKPCVFKLAAHCIMEAAWKPELGHDGSIEIPIPAGSFMTSIRKLAEDCHISVQQVRDGLDHLQGIGFIGTQIGTQRYTVVTVLNYRSYQCVSEDENTEKNTDCVLLTPPKEHSVFGETVENDDKWSLFSEGMGSNRAPLKEEEDKKLRTPSRGHRNCDLLVKEHARAIQGRHPKVRACPVGEVEKQLTAIVKRYPRPEWRQVLEGINGRHAGWCATPEWRKESGQFAKGLYNWLAPTVGRFLVEPPECEMELVGQTRRLLL